MNCPFCAITQGSLGSGAPEDAILEDTRHYFAKPALGHFVDGYTLVVTKDHVFSLAQLSPELLREVEAFVTRVRSRLVKLYDLPVLAFEHGEVDGRARAGSCIDHAHLHLLPVQVDLGEELRQHLLCEPLGELSEIRRYHEQRIPYLYYESGACEKSAFQVSADLPCQFVRRVIAKKLNRPEVWDWLVYPFRDRIVEFARAYAGIAGGASAPGPAGREPFLVL